MAEADIQFDEKEALRYFRAKPGDAGAVAAVRRAYAVLKKEVIPRHVIQKWDCRVVPATDTEKGRVILSNGTEFRSTNLARYINGCDKLLLFAATLGSRVDMAIRRLSVRSIAEGAAAQAVGASLIESYLDAEEILWKENLPAHYKYMRRFSPGYGDWDLAEQKKVFALLPCRTIGLTLTEGGLMAPSKSVTAVIGIHTNGETT